MLPRRRSTTHRPHRRARASRAGLTMVELVIAAGIIAVLLLATAAAMGENVDSTNAARRLVDGGVFLESVQEDLASLSGPELLAMNGQVVFSADAWADAPYRCGITVFQSATRLLTVELELIDQVSGRTVASVHTLRALV